MLRIVVVVGVLASAGCGDIFACDPACPLGTHCDTTLCVPDEPRSDAGTAGAVACDPPCSGAASVCSPAGHCVVCVTDGDCPTGNVCRTRFGQSTCLPGCADDDRCRGGGGAASLACCGGACVDTADDDHNCGGCGIACAPAHTDSSCSGGTCMVGPCDPGFQDCDQSPDDGCESNARIDPQNCGACGNVCSYIHGIAACSRQCYMTGCDFGWDDCNFTDQDGCETPVLADTNNCGACGFACAAVNNAETTCKKAMCGLRCADGFADCDGDNLNGCEVNLSSDAGNCGACGAACPQGQVCKGSGCTCLMCDNTFPNATARCANNNCVFDKCRRGFADCDNNQNNGCETATDGNDGNCGGCGKVCGQQAPACVGGACSVSGASCAAILAASPNAPDGVYRIDPDGGGGAAPFNVFCDMTTDGGGWTVCYNHNIIDVEEMNQSTVTHMSTFYGVAGEANEYGTDCRGTGHLLQPKTVRFTAANGTHWVQFNNPPDQIHEFFFAGSRARVNNLVNVTTWSSKGQSFMKQICNHDCPNFGYNQNNINQVADSTNTGTCFEHNSKSSDSNHHWAIFGDCKGSYVEGPNQGVNSSPANQPRGGFARVMLR